MSPFLLPLVSLVLQISVICHQPGQEWEATKVHLQLPVATVAFYRSSDGSVHLGPWACKNVATPSGAWVLAHELGHRWQQQQGLPYDEKQADKIGDRDWRAVYKKICSVRTCVANVKLGG